MVLAGVVAEMPERKVAAAVAQRDASKVEELEFAWAEWKGREKVAEKVG